MPLKNAVAILTGAGRTKGVGAATAKKLAAQGCSILINCLKSKEQAELLVGECKAFGVDAALYIGDVTQTEVCKGMAAFVNDKWGRADILVNCAGATKPAPYESLEKLTAEDFSHLFAVNATAPFLMAQAFQPLLQASGDAVIINVSSAAGISGKGSSIAYAVAKGAENTLTLSLAQALSPEVRVNAVCPSFIDSSWWDNAYKDRPEKYKGLIASMQQSNLLRKVLTPDDVANTIIDLINNRMMTGELIRLDAGMHIGKANKRETIIDQAPVLRKS